MAVVDEVGKSSVAPVKGPDSLGAIVDALSAAGNAPQAVEFDHRAGDLAVTALANQHAAIARRQM